MFKIERFFLFKTKRMQDFVKLLLAISNGFLLFFGLAFITLIVYRFGFHTTADTLKYIDKTTNVILVFMSMGVTMQLLLDFKNIKKRARPWEFVIYTALLLALLGFLMRSETTDSGFISNVLSSGAFRGTVLLTVSILELSKGVMRIIGRRTNPSLLLASSFLLIILVGGLLLMLPNATRSGISFIDSLFISTSAVCVTGLTPITISAEFTMVGNIILITLIQIGGLGLMTITSFFGMFFMGKSSIYNALAVRDMISSGSMNSLLRALFYILGFTLIIEALGMLFIWGTIHDKLGMTLEQELGFSIFHAISAFCNAGFSTYKDGLANSKLLQFDNIYMIVAFLIILGGIGFPILVNLVSIVKYHIKRIVDKIIHPDSRRLPRIRHLFNLNTKIVLSTTALLLVIPTIIIAFIEWNHAFAGMDISQKLVQSFFTAVTPRTAGFNNLNPASFTRDTMLLVMFLMWVGGAAQSTAGGVKVNAFAVSIVNIWSVIKGKKSAEMFSREVSFDSMRRANAVVILSVLTISIGLFFLCLTNPHIPVFNLVYEAISAIGTVGLSLNTTPFLNTSGKVIVILLMFVGRVGLLTFLMGIVPHTRHRGYSYPSDNIIIN